MARPRTPKMKAELTGTASRNPGRFATRKEPKGAPLGKPSDFLDAHGKRAWAGFVRELPWLMESDRALVEIVSTIRGRLLGKEDVGIQALSLLQSCLTKLGATPADRTKVTLPDDDEEEDEFFGAN